MNIFLKFNRNEKSLNIEILPKSMLIKNSNGSQAMKAKGCPI